MSLLAVEKDKNQAINQAKPTIKPTTFFSPKLKTKQSQKGKSRNGKTPEILPSIENGITDIVARDQYKARAYNNISPNRAYKIEVMANQGYFLNQGYKLDQKLVNHLHMIGVPVQSETSEPTPNLNEFLKIKSVNLTSQMGTQNTKSPQKPSGRGKNFRPMGKKMAFLDASFDKYAEQMQRIEFIDAKGLRRSLSGAKVTQYDALGNPVMSYIEEEINDNAQVERKIWTSAGKSAELHALRYKSNVQGGGFSNSPDYKRLHGKYANEEQNLLFQKILSSDPKNKTNNVTIKFNNPLDAIKESPMKAKAYSQLSEPSRNNSYLISGKPSTPLQNGMRTSNNPSFITPIDSTPNPNNNLLTSILNKSNNFTTNNTQGSPLKGSFSIPVPTNTVMTPHDKSEEFRNQSQYDSYTPKNPSVLSTGAGTPLEREKSDDFSTGTTNQNKGTYQPKSPSIAQRGVKSSNISSNNVYNNKPSPNIKPNLNNSFTSSSKNPNAQYDDQLKKPTTIIAPPQVYRYQLGPGNNVQLVRRVLKTRDWWEETAASYTPYHFKWQQTTRGFRYEKLIPNPNFTLAFNHFEFHREISTKNGLIKNLTYYCEQNKLNLFDLTPTTFVFDMDDEANFDTDMQRFAKFFIKNHPDQQQYPKPDPNDKKNHSCWYNFDYRKKSKFAPASLQNDKKPSQYLKPKLHHTFLKGFNVWVLKPTGLNRGRGIEIFNTLEALNEYVNIFFEGARAVKGQKGDEDEDEESESEDDGKLQNYKGPIVKSHTFVIQKYIEDLLVVNNRKFDIRVWVLITQDMQLYFFKEGYLRTCCFEYELKQETIDNKFVHLTNNAVQKHCDDYGAKEKGNQLSFSDFDKYIEIHGLPVDLRGKVIPRMKELITHSMSSVKKMLNLNERKYTFEVFGYDFMIDNEGTVWLIEVNTNPCIEESSPLLGKLIPRMIDDAFKLTLDVLFPKPVKPENDKNGKNNKKDDESFDDESMDSDSEEAKSVQANKAYSVDGYSDEENMWEHLCSLQVPKVPVRKTVKPSSNPGANK